MMSQTFFQVWMIFRYQRCCFEGAGYNISKHAGKSDKRTYFDQTDLKFSVSTDNDLQVKINPMSQDDDDANAKQGVFIADEIIGKKQSKRDCPVDNKFKIKQWFKLALGSGKIINGLFRDVGVPDQDILGKP